MTRSCFPDDPDIKHPPSPAAQIDELPMFAPPGWPERPPVKRTENRVLLLERSIDADFAAWQGSPDGQFVIDKVHAHALKMARAGAKRIGVKSLCERVRWEEKKHLDNRFTSRIARYLIEQSPHLGALIQLRQLEASESVSE